MAYQNKLTLTEWDEKLIKALMDIKLENDETSESDQAKAIQTAQWFKNECTIVFNNISDEAIAKYAISILKNLKIFANEIKISYNLIKPKKSLPNPKLLKLFEGFNIGKNADTEAAYKTAQWFQNKCKTVFEGIDDEEIYNMALNLKDNILTLKLRETKSYDHLQKEISDFFDKRIGRLLEIKENKKLEAEDCKNLFAGLDVLTIYNLIHNLDSNKINAATITNRLSYASVKEEFKKFLRFNDTKKKRDPNLKNKEYCLTLLNPFTHWTPFEKNMVVNLYFFFHRYRIKKTPSAAYDRLAKVVELELGKKPAAQSSHQDIIDAWRKTITLEGEDDIFIKKITKSNYDKKRHQEKKIKDAGFDPSYEPEHIIDIPKIENLHAFDVYTMTKEEFYSMDIVNRIDKLKNSQEMIEFIKRSVDFSKAEKRLFEIFALEIGKWHKSFEIYVKAVRERASMEGISSNYFSKLWPKLVTKARELDRDDGGLYLSFIPWQLVELKKMVNEIEAEYKQKTQS